jgi:hypothetical protein
MQLVEILLPLTDNAGHQFGPHKYSIVREYLTGRFGGMTAFVRSPADGTTKDGGATVYDDIVVFEVMTEALDPDWWKGYRASLEKEFRQDKIVVRAFHVTLL